MIVPQETVNIKSTVSVVIITLNAEAQIQKCLDSVRFATEIIVLDSGSQDRTVEICRTYTEQVYQTDWPGFGIQKNRGIDLATGHWVLVLDADEYLTPELQQEIQAIVNTESSSAVAYKMLRHSTFMGKIIRHGDWRNDWITRLFQRGAARYTEDRVHEKLCVQGEVSCLQGVLLHDTVTSVEDSLRKLNQYSTLGAEQRVAKGRGGNLLTAIVHGAWTFVRSYIVRRGFLDGQEGYLIALLTAQGSFYKYIKADYLYRTSSKII